MAVEFVLAVSLMWVDPRTAHVKSMPISGTYDTFEACMNRVRHEIRYVKDVAHGDAKPVGGELCLAREYRRGKTKIEDLFPPDQPK